MRGNLYLFRFVVMWALGIVSAASADIASTAYVNRYFYNTCNNSQLNLDMAAPGVSSQRRVLSIVDDLNNNSTTYAADLTSSAVVATTYLPSTLNLFASDGRCCPGGYYDGGYSECRSCGTWSTTTSVECTDEGEYRNGNSCSTCPTGYVCPAGTSGKISIAGFEIQCLAEGVYRFKNKCEICLDGYFCPAGQNDADDCGAGYWCASGERIECDYGANQCPGTTHATQPTTVACDDAITAISVATVPDCLDAGQYRNGNSCSACPTGYTCPAGTSGKISIAGFEIQCLAEGIYRIKNKCQICPDGNYCPENQNTFTDCGVGYWCASGARTACDYGANQCPDTTHATQPTTIACDNAWTFTN